MSEYIPSKLCHNDKYVCVCLGVCCFGFVVVLVLVFYCCFFLGEYIDAVI